MFSFEFDTIPYSHPWGIPSSERLAKLMKGDTRIAYLYEAPAKNTFRYRVYNMVQALNMAGNGVAASYFSNEELNILLDNISEFHVLIVSRMRYSGELNRLITRAQSKGKQVFFDIDDLIFDTDYTHLIVDTLDLPRNEDTWNHWFSLISRIRTSIKLCDAIITTNQFLAKQLEQHFDKPVFVIPNFMNAQQLTVSDQIFEKKKESGWQRDEFVTIGYFSGTQTHNRDFQVAETALANLLESESGVRLRIGGHLSLSPALSKHLSRIEFLPFCDFVNLQISVGKVDINLVPLQENIFSNCKSELKYFEAAAVGTPTIATPIFSYSKAINDGENGFIARSYDWYDKLVEVISTIKTHSAIAECAHKSIRDIYSPQLQNSVIEKVLLG